MSDAIVIALIGLIGTLAGLVPTIISSNKKLRTELKDDFKRSFEDYDKRLDVYEAKLDEYGTKMDSVGDQLSKHIKKDDDVIAEEWRVRILGFDNYLCNERVGLNLPYPCKSNYEQAMSDCDKYEAYIESNPDFHNGIGEDAIARIRRSFAYCQTNNMFGKRDEVV